LVGENGAGKTTLMRIAFGMDYPDAGQVLVHGKPVAWQSPRDAIKAGVGMVHQHFTLVPAMTVAENVELGADTSDRHNHWRFDRRGAEERVYRLSEASGLAIEPGALVRELSVAAQQRVEILKALSRRATVLILDEPTAVLAPKEIDEVLHWLRRYADGGGTAILITHKLREALAVADDVTVLRGGRTVLSAARADIDQHSLTRVMIGEERPRQLYVDVLQRSPSSLPLPDRRPVAVLEDVTASDVERREKVRATVAIHAGDLLGVAGVEGAGQHVLLRLLAGRVPPATGKLTLPPQVAFIPEDRHRDGLALDFTLAENMALRGAGTRRGFMTWPSIRRHTAALMRASDVRASSESAYARALSGGNQQRLVLARELDGYPELVVAENPTRGLDVRASEDVHERLRTASLTGAAVVIYSSDLDEVLALATRVLAVHAGSVREVALEKDLVGRAMMGLP
jgi:simple sugar transport system ATP-binding protein